MSRRAPNPKIHWQERFQLPSLDQLLSHLPRQQSQLILQARESILSLGSLKDSVIWHGIPWRWALTFSIDGDPTRQWAYIIPQPGKPLLALPLTSDMVATLPVRDLSRSVREGIQAASRVGDSCWPQWDLTSKPVLEDILVVVKHKHDMMLAGEVVTSNP